MYKCSRERIKKQELESILDLLEDLFIYVKETIQIMNQRITKASVKTEANGIDKIHYLWKRM